MNRGKYRTDMTAKGMDVSDRQHVEDIVLANKGDFKFSPEIGVNALAKKNEKGGMDALKRDVHLEGLKDGYVLGTRITKEGELEVSL